MSKNLIGNSLVYVMIKILSGEISADDIGKIYEGTCFTKEEISQLINRNRLYWRLVADDRAEAEVASKHGVDSIWQIKDGQEHEQAHVEMHQRTDELEPIVTAEAERLLENLWDNNKIVQTRYRIPEGQKVMAKHLPSNMKYYQEEEFETSGDCRGEVVCVNGEFYDCDHNLASLGMGNSGLFESELELIANQLKQYYVMLDSPSDKYDRMYFMQKMFPQYKDALTQISETLNSNRYLRENKILELLKDALRQKGEHTAEEIGDGVKDLTQGELGEALTAITDIGELQKAPHSLE